jgi:hypothetical protein
MEVFTPEVVLDFASRTGGNLILLFVIIALVTGRLVPKPWVDDIRRDRDEWKQVARGGVQQASETTKAQVKTASVAEEAARIVTEVLRQQQAKEGQG